ncbi:MAG: hypothetical protein WBG86_09245, partial [Polyangiales bacterium]
PLAPLLNGGKAIPGAFSVSASLEDIASLVSPTFDSEGADFGALTSLVDAEMISCVDLIDRRARAEVQYRADGRRDTIGNIAGGGDIGFDIDEIHATDGDLELLGEASELRYLGIKALAGEIVYRVSGVDDLTITSDFGGGSAWPVTSFACCSAGGLPLRGTF